MSKFQSTNKYQLPDKLEFSKFYDLQKNNIHLQKNVKSYIKALIQILKKCSTGINQWKDEWNQFDADNQNKLSEYERNIWKLFHISLSSVTDYTENIDDIVEKLQHIQESISKPDKKQTLEFKINEARVDIDVLDQQIEQLDEQIKALKKKINTCQDSSWQNQLICINYEKRRNEFIQRRTSKEKSMKNKIKTMQRKLNIFNTRKSNLYEASKKEEIDRYEQLKEQANAFLRAFGKTPDSLDELPRDFNAKTSFDHWEKKFLRGNINQLFKSLSIESKVSCNDNQSDV